MRRTLGRKQGSDQTPHQCGATAWSPQAYSSSALANASSARLQLQCARGCQRIKQSSDVELRRMQARTANTVRAPDQLLQCQPRKSCAGGICLLWQVWHFITAALLSLGSLLLAGRSRSGWDCDVRSCESRLSSRSDSAGLQLALWQPARQALAQDSDQTDRSGTSGSTAAEQPVASPVAAKEVSLRGLATRKASSDIQTKVLLLREVLPLAQAKQVRMETLSDSALSVAVYPEFKYNASGACPSKPHRCTCPDPMSCTQVDLQALAGK